MNPALTTRADTRWFSLQRRLLALLLGGVAMAWLIMMAFSYADAHHEIDELFDAQLAQAAQTLLARRHQMEKARRHHQANQEAGDSAEAYDNGNDGDQGEDDDSRAVPAAIHRYQSKIMFQVWRNNGELLMRSANAPTDALTTRPGFSEINHEYGHWRTFSVWDEHHHYQVQVAENHAIRDELTGHIAMRLLLPALVGLPLLGVWVWLATSRALRSLDTVAEQIAARHPAKLKALAPGSAPTEIRPLVTALNDLFQRVDQALELEHRFTADAAHELRTPLAALTTQAQVAMRARDEAEKDHAIEQLATVSRRAARLVDQLLTLARLDPEAARPATPVDLASLAEEVCANHGEQALNKDIALELEAEPAIVRGNADMLRILLRNLIDNALRYTPNGGKVVVAVTRAALAVTDNGPGIAASARQSVFDRFRRLAGQDTEGSGLGLSIVARIAEMHGAAVLLADGLTSTNGNAGLRVEVRFPS